MVTAYWAFAAALCAGAAGWLAVGHERSLRRARLMLAGGGAVEAPAPWPWERWWPEIRRRPEWLCPVLGVALAVLGEAVLPLIAGLVAVPLAGRKRRARERRRAGEARADGVIALCGAVAGELRAGLQPGQALLLGARAAGGLGGAEAGVLAAARFGGDVPAALRQAAREDGADGLAGMAACWQVAVDGGAGLAAGLDRLDAVLRERRDQRERLRSQLAGAWATVAVLALLPAVGLVLGAAMGAEPLRVLFHTPAGLACLTAGALLEAAGIAWAARIVRAGEKP
ncbi:type II secretion system F family protein [Streptomyces purpureus]|uniref:Membrane protein n=1 Tax=Streptomyces purpureus TaxID=1951 RepID=A0A918LQC7_9ACTN|nr:type II secretion system F family protein [Streptomyces purpureus]GGT38333.1 membrane protein [Streptomyces purpureus]